MAKKGINSDAILTQAVKLVEEKGYSNFSLRELAARLEVKPASLYNHIQSIDDITTAVALYSVQQLKIALANAVKGKSPDDAFMAGTLAYRRFAIENPELYKALINIPSTESEFMVQAAAASFEPLYTIIQSYGAGMPYTLHFARALRAQLHGFIELCNNGFLPHGPASRDATFDEIMHAFLNSLHAHRNA